MSLTVDIIVWKASQELWRTREDDHLWNVRNVKSELINMTWAWDKKKSESRQETYPWPPEHRAHALSTELGESMESKLI